jgi:DNA-binding PadR family transcriptional regulator
VKRMPRFHRNLWAFTVLSLLRERSMHPYEMQRLIRERHKDDLLDLKRGSLYHAIERLERAGRIESVETSREGKRPERTTYQITEAGLDELLEWLREMLSRPSSDPNEFLAGVAHIAHLPPEEVADCLEARTTILEAEIAGLEAVLRTLTPKIGRIVLLEVDLARDRKQAELEWVCALVHDLRSQVHVWDPETLFNTPGAIPGVFPNGVTDEGKGDTSL